MMKEKQIMLSKRKSIGAIYNPDSSIKWTEDSASSIFQKVPGDSNSQGDDDDD